MFKKRRHVNLPATVQVSVMCKKKGKAIPVQVWIGPEGSRRWRLPDMKTLCT